MSRRGWREKRKQPCAHVCDELAVTCGAHPDPKEEKKGEEKEGREETRQRITCRQIMDDALGPNGCFLSFSPPPETSSGILK